jgi:hypothetical protein
MLIEPDEARVREVVVNEQSRVEIIRLFDILPQFFDIPSPLADENQIWNPAVKLADQFLPDANEVFVVLPDLDSPHAQDIPIPQQMRKLVARAGRRTLGATQLGRQRNNIDLGAKIEFLFDVISHLVGDEIRTCDDFVETATMS